MNSGNETIAGVKTFSSTIVGSINGNAATSTLASTVTVSDSTANTYFPIVFHNENDGLLDDTGSLTYNPNKGELKFPDNKKIIFGDGNDLQIYHDGGNTFIDEVGTGDLVITTTNLKMRAQTVAHDYLIGTANGSIQLLHQGVKELETAANGITITGDLSVGGDITALTSDKRLKENIQIIENPLQKINQLSGFTYNWSKEKCEKAGFEPSDEKQVGVFAQDIQEVLPEAVKPAPFDTDENGKSKSGENYLTVQYEKIVPLLIECIKDQQKQINELKDEIILLKNK